MSSGPKYIAEGTYGCAYRPSISCDKKPPRPNTISKVFPTEDEAKIEYKIYGNIPPELVEANDKDPFFIMPIHRCEIKLQQLGAEDLKCKLLEKPYDKWSRSGQNANDLPLWQIIYPDGGIDIYKMLTLKSKKKRVSFDSMFMSMKSIFKGLVYLNRNNLVHQDIKPENLTFNDQLLRTYMIDFGLMTNMNDIYSSVNWHLVSHNYRYYPPEFTLASLLISSPIRGGTRATDNFIINLFNKDINHVNTIMINYSGYTKNHTGTDEEYRYVSYKGFYKLFLSGTILLMEDYHDDKLLDIYNKLIIWWSGERVKQVEDMLDIVKGKIGSLKNVKTRDENLNSIADILLTQTHKIDVYMLGITLLQMFAECLEQKRIKNSPFIIKQILKLIMNMTNFNVFKRYTPEEALSEYNNIISIMTDLNMEAAVDLIKIMPEKMIVTSKEMLKEEVTLYPKTKLSSRETKRAHVYFKSKKETKEHKKILEELRKAHISLNKKQYGKDYRSTAELLDAIFKYQDLDVDGKKITYYELAKRVKELKTIREKMPSGTGPISTTIRTLENVMKSMKEPVKRPLTKPQKAALSKIAESSKIAE